MIEVQTYEDQRREFVKKKLTHAKNALKYWGTHINDDGSVKSGRDAKYIHSRCEDAAFEVNVYEDILNMLNAYEKENRNETD